MKSLALKIGSVVLGVGALIWFAQGQDWLVVWDAIQHANVGWLAVAVILQLVAMYIRAMRWRSFLGQPYVDTNYLFLVSNVGFMGNGVLPARMGELIRPFLVGKNTPHTFSTALATIIVERVFDLLAILLILAFVLAVYPFPEGADWIRTSTSIAIPMFFGFLGVVLCITYAPQWSLRIVKFFVRPLPEGLQQTILKAVVSFELGASTFKRPLSFIYCLGHTFLLWLLIAFSELVVLWAFGITEVSFVGALFLMVFLCFAVMAPQLPGYIGVYHMATKAILVYTFGLDPDLSAAVAIVMWFTQVPPIIVAGFICLMVMGISFRNITTVSQQAAPEDPPLPVDAKL